MFYFYLGEYLKIKEGTKERSVCGEKSDYVLTFTDNVISIVVNTVDEDSGYALSYERKDGRASNRKSNHSQNYQYQVLFVKRLPEACRPEFSQLVFYRGQRKTVG